MSVASLIAVYFVVWWIVLFAVLPWGTRTQDDEGEVVLGTPSSAPSEPRLIRKAIATSIVAAVVTFGIWYLVDYSGYDVEAIADFFLPPK
jgi:predicted secreted protein